jgi:hypothetical protein
MDYKTYKIELINGKSGTLSIPAEQDFKRVMELNEFIEDQTTNVAVRSSAIIKYELVD